MMNLRLRRSVWPALLLIVAILSVSRCRADDVIFSSAPVDGGISGVDRFAWSPDGAAAVVYSSDSRQAQILRKLDGAPTVDSAIDFSTLGGPLTALAFDGKQALAGAGGVYLADSSGLKLLP